MQTSDLELYGLKDVREEKDLIGHFVPPLLKQIHDLLSSSCTSTLPSLVLKDSNYGTFFGTQSLSFKIHCQEFFLVFYLFNILNILIMTSDNLLYYFKHFIFFLSIYAFHLFVDYYASHPFVI